MPAIDQVLKLLPELSQEELKEVKLHLQALTQVSGTTPTSLETDWLLVGIISELTDRGLAATGERIDVTNSRQFHGFGPKSERFRKIFEEAIPNLTRVEKAVLGQLLAKCLASYIQPFRVVTRNALLQSVEMVPEAFEKQFPNYIGAGMAHVVIRSLIRK